VPFHHRPLDAYITYSQLHNSLDAMAQPLQVLKPRLAPRGLVDTLICSGAMILMLAAICGAPWAIALMLTGSTTVAIGAGMATYVFFLLFVVHEIEVWPEGVRFKRHLGTPKFLAWDQITSVGEVTATEVVLHGWFWPLIPGREMAPSFSALGHYRIDFGNRWIYFPPADPVEFELAFKKASGVVG